MDTENLSRATLEQSAKTAGSDTLSELKKTAEGAIVSSAERPPMAEAAEKPARRTNDAMLTEMANRKMQIFLEKYPLKEISALNPDIKESDLLVALSEFFKDATEIELYEQPADVISGFSLVDNSNSAILGLRDTLGDQLGLDRTLDDLAKKKLDSLLDKVRPPRPYVDLYFGRNEIDLPQTRNIVAYSYPFDGSQEVSWFSDNPAVATVRDDNKKTIYIPQVGYVYIIMPEGSYGGKGVIETHSVGTVTISAQNKETGAVAACTISVQIFPKSITISPTSRYFCGPPEPVPPTSWWYFQQLTATVLPENATDKSVTWISTRPELYSVSDTGLVTVVDIPAAYGVHVSIIARTNMEGIIAISDMLYGPN